MKLDMMQNEYAIFLANIGFDTDKNEPSRLDTFSQIRANIRQEKRPEVSLLFTWFDLDGDMQLSNFDLLHAYGAIRRGLAQLGVAPVLSRSELKE